MEIVLIIIAILGFGALIYLQTRPKPQTLDSSAEQIAELKAELQISKSEKDELSGKNKQMYAQITNFQADQRNLQEKNNELTAQLSKLHAEQKQRQQTFEEQIAKLEQSRHALEEERLRIRREDEAEQAAQIAKRDSIWNDHESTVLALLNDLCQKPELNFKTYDNKTLPEGWSGGLKPDFMLELLDFFVVFDAKSSRSENLANYLAENVKKTAEKFKNAPRIYSSVFFIVPSQAIGELKKLHYFEQGFSFFIISPEALAPILASFKKIESYEFAENLTPEQRENIVNTIAELSQQINFTNALNLLSTQRGISSLQRLKNLDTKTLDEVQAQETKMRLKNFTPTEFKELMQSTHAQQKTIDDFTAPKASVKPLINES